MRIVTREELLDTYEFEMKLYIGGGRFWAPMNLKSKS